METVQMVTKEVPFFGDYTLRYGWKGLEAMAKALNTPAFTDFDRIIAEMGPEHLRKIVWAGLIHKYPNLTADATCELIDEFLDEHDVTELSDIVGQAMIASGIITPPSQPGEGGDMGESKSNHKRRNQRLSKT